jgi:cell division protein FtsN
MTDSINKKLKEKNTLDDDLDAMLDDAESSLAPLNELQDDEDAIDRLLMEAGFDSDDELVQPEMSDVAAASDADLHDELDELLGFDGFEGDFKMPEKTQAAVESGQAVEDFSLALPDEQEVEEDAIDRLLMDAGADGDDISMPVIDDADDVSISATDDVDDVPMPVIDDSDALEELDEFSDFSDFNEPGIASALETDEPEAAVAEIEESGMDEAADTDEELDDFSDFSDFNEPDMISLAIDEPELAAEDLSAPVAVGLPDEIDDFSTLPDEIDDFSVPGDDLDETGMIHDDEIEALALAESDLTAVDMQQQAIDDESLDDLQIDENAIDDLLMDSGSDSESLLEQAAGEDELFGDDMDLSEIADLFQLNEAPEGFSREIEEDQLAETEQSSQDEGDFLLPDFDITADMETAGMEGDTEIKDEGFTDALADAAFLKEEDETVPAFEPEKAELKPESVEAVPESQPEQAAAAAVNDIGNAGMSSLGLDQEDLKKQLEDAENKVKKTKRFGYAALGFGAVALSAAAGLGVMAYSAKSEVSKLAEQVSTLEASLAKNIDNNPNEEINALMNSVVQLNQQVYGFITQIKETPQFPIDLLNNKVSDIVVKQELVSKALDMLQVKIGGEQGSIAFKPLVTGPVKVEPVPVKEEQAHELAPAKAESSHEHAPTKPEAVKEAAPEHAATKDQAVHDVTAPVREKAKQEAAPAKQEVTPAKVEAAPKSVPAKAKIQPEAVPAKPIAPPQVVVKEEPVKASQQAASAGKWGINLVAFKQEWFAKSKAAEFARLGVFAEVIPVRERNSTMYRLRVGGFKSKAEAFANTDSIKKTLNLDSVWVSDN